MRWEELTSKGFEKAVKESGGVCILPIGVLEKHGDHLPLGTDMYAVTAIANKAAEMTNTVVFPFYFLGQIAEARHVKGTLAASHKLIMEALLEMCDECHRNGFTKILLLSGHGGNCFFLPFFVQQFPGLNRPYAVYTSFANHMTKAQIDEITARSGETDMGEHAGFSETALMMHLRPDLVHMEEVQLDQSKSLCRLRTLQEQWVYTGFDWYARYPHHFAGDPSRATAAHGAAIFDIVVENTAEAIRRIKGDEVSPALVAEYNGLCGERHP